METKEIKIDVLRRSALASEMKICCNLSPEEMREQKKEVEDLLPAGSPETFFMDDVEIILDTDYKDLAPVKCSEKEGYWHYIACG